MALSDIPELATLQFELLFRVLKSVKGGTYALDTERRIEDELVLRTMMYPDQAKGLWPYLEDVRKAKAALNAAVVSLRNADNPA
jgi:hypothetical protein